MRVDFSLVRSLSAVAVAGMLLTACGGDDGPPVGPGPNSVAKVLESLTVEGGGTASLKTGEVPVASGGPAVTVTTADAVTQGGTSEVTITSSTAFRKIFVSMAGKDGYYEVNLPASVTTATLLTTYGVTESGDVSVEFAVATAAGQVGATSTSSVSIIDVGTGDVQVSVSWNSPADVDLHVVEPGGEEIYYGNISSTAGGSLDLDSNADCNTDDKRAENITWNSAPPRGTYIVRVDHYLSCGASATDYVVTVRRKGKATQTFTGQFTGPGDQGSAGSGVLITQFTY